MVQARTARVEIAAKHRLVEAPKPFIIIFLETANSVAECHNFVMNERDNCGLFDDMLLF